MTRNIQYALRKQRPVRDDGTAVWGQLGQPVDELFVARPLWLQKLNAQLAGPSRDRTRGELLAPTTGCVRPGDHGEDLMAGLDQRVQGRDRDIRSAAEDNSHRRSLGRT